MAWGAGALAAVNDDFSVQGRPKHMSMIDGELWTTGIQPRGAAFAFSANGQRADIGEPHPAITGTLPEILVRSGPLERGPSPTSIRSRRSRSRGGAVESPPGRSPTDRPSPRWCAARLIPTGRSDGSARTTTASGALSSWTRGPNRVRRRRSATGDTAGTVVLASRARGDWPRPSCRWKARSTGRSAVADAGLATSGRRHRRYTPLLVRNGVEWRPVPPRRPYIFNDNPRTAVGITAGCQDRVGPRFSAGCSS